MTKRRLRSYMTDDFFLVEDRETKKIYRYRFGTREAAEKLILELLTEWINEFAVNRSLAEDFVNNANLTSFRGRR